MYKSKLTKADAAKTLANAYEDISRSEGGPLEKRWQHAAEVLLAHAGVELAPESPPPPEWFGRLELAQYAGAEARASAEGEYEVSLSHRLSVKALVEGYNRFVRIKRAAERWKSGQAPLVPSMMLLHILRIARGEDPGNG